MEDNLRKICKEYKNPIFPLKAININILDAPNDFYEKLLYNISKATQNITIVSLYIGTDEKSHKLILSLKDACQRNNKLKITILIDYHRSRRNNDICLQLLYNILLCNYPNQIKISLFKNSSILSSSKIKNKLLSYFPSLSNEILGVFHMKMYIFDNNMITSGANLSYDYFTNRQDRYIEINNLKMALFYHELFNILSAYSYQLSTNRSKSILLENKEKLNDFRNKLIDHFKNTAELNEKLDVRNERNFEFDSFAFPTLQIPNLNINHDKEILIKILKILLNDTTIHFKLKISTAYLNLPTFLHNILLKNINNTDNMEIIVSCPKANGFYNGKGIKKYIPTFYSILEKELYDKINKNKSKIYISEYIRDMWTFHSKGIWFTTFNNINNKQNSKEFKAECTIIGSSNFGKRSYERDIENQLYIYTKNEELQKKLGNEYNNLRRYTEKVNDTIWKRKDRMVKIGSFKIKNIQWIKPVTNILRAYL